MNNTNNAQRIMCTLTTVRTSEIKLT